MAFFYKANSNSAREGWPEMEVPPAGTLPIEEWYVTCTLTERTALYLQYWDAAEGNFHGHNRGASFLVLKNGICLLMWWWFVGSCHVAHQCSPPDVLAG